MVEPRPDIMATIGWNLPPPSTSSKNVYVEQRYVRPWSFAQVCGSAGSQNCKGLSQGFQGLDFRPTAPELPGVILLMDKILHDPKDPKLWELWYIPYNG